MDTDSAHAKTPLPQCRAALQTMREEIDDLAAAVAERVRDRFEAEVREATEDEFVFDTASMLRMLLANESALAFQDALDELLFERLNGWAKVLEQAGVQEVEVARLELDGLRKQFRLYEFVHELVGEALDKVKPGVGYAVKTMLGDFFRDPFEQAEALERDMKEDAVRVRKVLLQCRGALVARIEDEVRGVVRAAYFAYIRVLDAPAAPAAGG